MAARRYKPLTVADVGRRLCARCRRRRGHAVWNICADGGRNRPICKACDLELNALVLLWMGIRDWRAKLGRYARKLGRG